MSLWNDLKRPTLDKHRFPQLTPSSFKEGTWACHTQTGKWFKLIVLDGSEVGGFDFHGGEVIVPWEACHLPWIPPQEAGARSRRPVLP